MMRMTLVCAGVLLVFAPSAVAAGEKRGLAPLQRVDLSTPEKRESSRLSTDAARALMAGEHDRAVTLAERAMAANPKSPWPHYNRAAALVPLGRVEEAVVAFEKAEELFVAMDDSWGRSVAIYGRAHALREAGECRRASAAFEQYAAFVQRFDAGGSETALRLAAACAQPATPVATEEDARPRRGVEQGARPVPGKDKAVQGRRGARVGR